MTLIITIIEYGVKPAPMVKEFRIISGKTKEWAKDMKTRVLRDCDCDILIHDSSTHSPYDLDGTAQELYEDELVEWKNTVYYQILLAEGAVIRKNSKYVKADKPDAEIQVRSGAVLLKNMR
jgi:hypothetical protein